jgi:hypothetical protein
MKASGVLGSPQIAVESDGSKVTVLAFDSSDSSAHTDALEVADGNGDKFKMIFKTENLKMVAGSYEVKISSKGISHFKNKAKELEYWITTEAGSNYTKA